MSTSSPKLPPLPWKCGFLEQVRFVATEPIPRRVYADWNAETPECEESVAVQCECLKASSRGAFGNPSSAHFEGKKTKSILESARSTIERECGAPEGTLIFTSGATESNHFAIAAGMNSAGTTRQRIVTTPFEHASVSRVAADYDPMFLRLVGGIGAVDASSLSELASEPDVGMVSIILAHNEIGIVQSIAAIRGAMRAARRDRETGLLSATHRNTLPMLHYDATQLLGKDTFSVVDSEADFVSWSAHKFRGPNGVGGLFFDERSDLAVYPRCCPASGTKEGQELGLRAGTENAIGAAAAAAALSAENRHGKDGGWARTRKLAIGIAETVAREENIVVNAAPYTTSYGGCSRLCNTINLSFKNATGVAVAKWMDAVDIKNETPGIAVSTGSACSKSHPSTALAAIGIADELIRGAIRVSIGSGTTTEDAASITSKLVALARNPYLSIRK